MKIQTSKESSRTRNDFLLLLFVKISQQLLQHWLFVLPYATSMFICEWMNEWLNTIQFVFAHCALIVCLHLCVYVCECMKSNRCFLRRANHSGIYKFSLLLQCLSPSGPVVVAVFLCFSLLSRLMYCCNTHEHINEQTNEQSTYEAFGFWI